jgi:hypothetical protein
MDPSILVLTETNHSHFIANALIKADKDDKDGNGDKLGLKR